MRSLFVGHMLTETKRQGFKTKIWVWTMFWTDLWFKWTTALQCLPWWNTQREVCISCPSGSCQEIYGKKQTSLNYNNGASREGTWSFIFIKHHSLQGFKWSDKYKQQIRNLSFFLLFLNKKQKRMGNIVKTSLWMG